jgi:hypothetical protein
MCIPSSAAWYVAGVKKVTKGRNEGRKATKKQALTEIDQKVSPSPPLPHRQRHDTTDIVGRAPLFLGKVADKLGPEWARLGHDVEQERLDVVVERLVVEELLREEAEVLAIDLRAGGGGSVKCHGLSRERGPSRTHLGFPTVDFKHRDLAVAINLVPGRVSHLAFELRRKGGGSGPSARSERIE